MTILKGIPRPVLWIFSCWIIGIFILFLVAYSHNYEEEAVVSNNLVLISDPIPISEPSEIYGFAVSYYIENKTAVTHTGSGERISSHCGSGFRSYSNSYINGDYYFSERFLCVDGKWYKKGFMMVKIEEQENKEVK